MDFAPNNTVVTVHQGICETFKNCPVSIIRLVDSVVGHLFPSYFGIHFYELMAAHELGDDITFKLLIINCIVHTTALVKAVPMSAENPRLQ
jgi:hypothetical protein